MIHAFAIIDNPRDISMTWMPVKDSRGEPIAVGDLARIFYLTEVELAETIVASGEVGRHARNSSWPAIVVALRRTSGQEEEVLLLRLPEDVAETVRRIRAWGEVPAAPFRPGDPAVVEGRGPVLVLAIDPEQGAMVVELTPDEAAEIQRARDNCR